MATKTFNVSFPKELADLIDKKTAEQFGSRSDFLRAAALRYLREEQGWQDTTAYMKKMRAEVKPGNTASEAELEDYRKTLTKAGASPEFTDKLVQRLSKSSLYEPV